MGQRYALIIGNTQYEDPKISELISPNADANDLSRVLQAQEIGAFDIVDILLNKPLREVLRAIEKFFIRAQYADLLLLYFSGHGIKDDEGQLFLAVKDTDHELLESTAIKSGFIDKLMTKSLSRQQVLVLDCCNSGAFAKGTKAIVGNSMGTAAAFNATGMGRFVLTATDATQYAWEGDNVTGLAENSVFTRYLVQGLETGEADLDGDGKITIDEWYAYAFDQLKQAHKKQTPMKWSDKQQGTIVIANNPKPGDRIERIPVEIYQKPARNPNQADLELLHTLASFGDGVSSVAFSPDGSLLATGSLFSPAQENTAQLRLWRVDNGALHRQMAVKSVLSVAFSPDGSILASGSSDGIRLWHVGDGRLLRQFGIKQADNVAFSPDGRLLASFSRGEVELWRVEDGRLLRRLGKRLKAYSTSSIAFSPDGSLLATGGIKDAQLWSVRNGILVRELKETLPMWDRLIGGTFPYLNCVAFSPDGSLLAVSASDGVQLWSVSNGTQLNKLEKSGFEHGVTFSPNGSLLVTVNNLGVKLWSAKDGALLRYLEYEKSPDRDRIGTTQFGSVAFSPDGRLLASGANDGVRVWAVS